MGREIGQLGCELREAEIIASTAGSVDRNRESEGDQVFGRDSNIFHLTFEAT